MVVIVTSVSARDQKWVHSDDEEVRTKLEQELRRVKASESLAEALNLAEGEDARGGFLSATKLFHPNRFARRPAEIRKLANDVYIEIKEAYDKGKLNEASESLKRSKTSKPIRAISNEPSEDSTPEKALATTRSDDSAARKDLAARRRERLRMRLNSSSEHPAIETEPSRGAQIRTNTQPQIEGPSDAQLQESQFTAAIAQLDLGKFSEAAVSFKKLAVARPTDKRYRMHMHYCQGKYHQAAGRHSEARSEYQRALGIDASFSLAHKAMATLPQDPDKKKTGLLSRLFRK